MSPTVERGPGGQLKPFCSKLAMKKLGKKTQCMRDQLLLSAAVLARWWQPVASVEALNLLYLAMRVVLYQRIAMAIETARECGAFYCCFVFCRPGGRWGNAT